MSKEALVGWAVLVAVSVAMWLTGERDLEMATWPGIIAGVVVWLIAGDLRRKGDYKAAQARRLADAMAEEKPRLRGI